MSRRVGCSERVWSSLAIGERYGIAVNLMHLGEVTQQMGEHDAAGTMLDEGLAIMQELDDRIGTATALQILGNFALDRNDFRTAAPLFRESLAIRQALGYRRGIIFSLEGLAAVVAGFDSMQHAAQIWGRHIDLRRGDGATPGAQPTARVRPKRGRRSFGPRR